MLAAGVALVQPSAVNTEMAGEMLAVETEARRGRKGLWKTEGDKIVFSALAPGQKPGAWRIAEGRIRKASIVKNVIYLNFGDDWRTDFTIGIQPAVRRALALHGIDALALAYKDVRVHGWLDDYNGPYIELMAPEWLEITGDHAQTNETGLGAAAPVTPSVPSPVPPSILRPVKPAIDPVAPIESATGTAQDAARSESGRDSMPDSFKVNP